VTSSGSSGPPPKPLRQTCLQFAVTDKSGKFKFCGYIPVKYSMKIHKWKQYINV
jgi:hypothetical protein